MAKDTMRFYATGRRKSAIARVWLMPGTGKMQINRRDAEEYLARGTNFKLVEQPLNLAGVRETYDVWCTARGGGLAGQAGAIRLGIARALLRVSNEHREPLKGRGLFDARRSHQRA